MLEAPRPCRSPPHLALHPCLDLYGFRFLSNSDHAPVFLFILCTRLPCPGTCLDQAGARFGLSLASGRLCLLRLSLDLSRLDQCQFGFGGGSRPLVFFRWCPDWMPSMLNKWTCLRQVYARFGLNLASGQDGCKVWIWVWKVDLSRLNRCQFEFGGGSGPLVFLTWCSDWMPVYGRWVEGLGWVWLKVRLAEETGPSMIMSDTMA